MADKLLDDILTKHGLTARDIAHGSPTKDPVRAARMEILLAFMKAHRSVEDLGKVLNMPHATVRHKIRKAEVKMGIPSAYPKQDSSKAMKARRLRTIHGPAMVDAPGERRACILENQCLNNLVRLRPGAANASCPSGCTHFLPISEESRIDDAARRGPGHLF